MGMFDEIKAEAVMKGPSCSIGLIVQQMTPEERADFDLACADPLIVTTVITRVLARRGYKVKTESLRRHRKKECRCE